MRWAWLVAGILACGGPDPAEKLAKPGKAGKGARAEARVMPADVAAAKGPMTPELKAAPNVLVIVWDTVRADHLSLYGYGKDTTPRINAWAADRGVVYQRAISPGVWTLPSHASLFTGLPERGHGVNADHNWLDNQHLTVAEALLTQGFDTWAFVANPYLTKDTNLLQGFERIENPWSPRWRPAAEAFMKSKLIAQDASTPVSPAFEGRGGSANNKYLFKEAGPVAGQALGAWLDARPDPERPFLAFINYMEAHLPRIPAMESRRKVMSAEEIERSFKLVQSTNAFHEWMVGVQKYDELDLRAIAGVYDASLIDLDAATGALLDDLDRRGLAEDTLVIITSDHGENLGDHDLLLHKYSVYNSLTRVPLIVAWKGHLQPTLVDRPTSVGEVLVRALEQGGIPLSEEMKKRFLSQDLDAQGAVAEYGAVADGSIDRIKRVHPGTSTAKLERTWESIDYGPWKYIEASDGTRELFEVTSDPSELRNRIGEQAEVVSDLKARIETFKQSFPRYVPQDVLDKHPRDAELKEGLEALGYVN